MQSVDHPQLARAEFACRAPDADSVFLVGRFRQRRTNAHRMERNSGGEWTTVLNLPRGSYRYKFVAIYRGLLNVSDACPDEHGKTGPIGPASDAPRVRFVG